MRSENDRILKTMGIHSRKNRICFDQKIPSKKKDYKNNLIKVDFKKGERL
jgi:hypothetical protein